MKLNDWKKLIKVLHKNNETTTYEIMNKLKVYKFTENDKMYKIVGVIRCKEINSDIRIKVYVEFNKHVKLSLFQTNLLFHVFGLYKLPYDYADYHKCEAGKKFIKNIKGFYTTKKVKEMWEYDTEK